MDLLGEGRKEARLREPSPPRQRFVMCFVICVGWVVEAGCQEPATFILHHFQ